MPENLKTGTLNKKIDSLEFFFLNYFLNYQKKNLHQPTFFSFFFLFSTPLFFQNAELPIFFLIFLCCFLCPESSSASAGVRWYDRGVRSPFVIRGECNTSVSQTWRKWFQFCTGTETLWWEFQFQPVFNIFYGVCVFILMCLYFAVCVFLLMIHWRYNFIGTPSKQVVRVRMRMIVVSIAKVRTGRIFDESTWRQRHTFFESSGSIL